MANRRTSARSVSIALALSLAALSGLTLVAAKATAADQPASPDLAQADPTKPPEGFQSLFNGKDLSGWHIMGKGQFSVRDGQLLLNRGGGWLRSENQYDDFELRMVFRFGAPNSNSGIFFRSNDHPGPNKAYQVQTKDDGSIGSIYARSLDKPTERKDAKLVQKALRPGDAWQEYVIIAQGDKVDVRLNGELITRAEKLASLPGHIGIQGEGGLLEFKAVYLKSLAAKP